MKCTNCNSELPNETKFCPYCGTKIENENVTNTNFTTNENDFDDIQTEIIFDKKLPKEKLKKENKMQNVIMIFAFLIVISIAGAAIFLINKKRDEEMQEMAKTGIETLENGKIVYNKGNKTYASDEIIEYNGELYYFDDNENMFKGEEGEEGTWKEVKKDWYFIKDDGKIFTKQWVDNEQYYVDEYGRMLKNQRVDGYLLGEDGRWVDEEALKAEEEAKEKEEEKKAQQPTREYVQPTRAYIQPTGEFVNVDRSKAVWIENYDTFTDYTEFDDETNVDISFKYPVFGGQNPDEANKMNQCLMSLRDDLIAIADAKINEEEEPKKYSITTAEVANIEENKINVNMKGKLERSGKSARDVRIRFIYDRQSGTAFVKE